MSDSYAPGTGSESPLAQPTSAEPLGYDIRRLTPLYFSREEPPAVLVEGFLRSGLPLRCLARLLWRTTVRTANRGRGREDRG